MKQITEDQFGFERAELDSLFTYRCGGPSSVMVFVHPMEENDDEQQQQQRPTHTLVRQKDGFTISMYKNPDLDHRLDDLPDELAFNIVRRWLNHGSIELWADQSERAYV